MPHMESASPQMQPADTLKQQTQPQDAPQQKNDDQPHQHRLHQDSPSVMSPSTLLGIVNYSESPRSASKSVSIAQYAETISPLMLGRQKSVDDLHFSIVRDLRMPVVKSPRTQRLSGRLSSPALQPFTPPATVTEDQEPPIDAFPFDVQPQMDRYELLIDQVSSWIKEEREKRSRRKSSKDSQQEDDVLPNHLQSTDGDDKIKRRGSNASDKSLDLDKLEGIVKQNLSIGKRRDARHKPSIRRLLRKLSSISDSDHHDSDLMVPSCDVVLDNSKTFASNGGAPESDVSSSDELKRVPSFRDFDAWASFKFEIVRLAHTLRLKGWRKISMDMSSEITVQRLSGALTNAVYVVSPPQHIPELNSNAATQGFKKPPPKLLLRIYGPQVEHLIDREAELAILRRLARKSIGPRLLGTFANGRFEEYFYAKTLTAADLRSPDTSRQIAKRMRELHDGVELLDQERDDGAFVWRNWDKWLQRVESIVCWMDQQITSIEPGTKPIGTKAWMRRGHICGVPWNIFKDTVEKHRQWLQEQYGGPKQLKDQLVFAHNDTQYGNILRLMPTGESPLLLPANSHKQLVVIDFEYASANAPGLEFANHFTEWCYNYHDKRKPYACNTNRYPTPDEQDRFIRAYVRHRAQFNVNTPNLGPVTAPGETQASGEPTRRLTTSVSDFILDQRNPCMPTNEPSPEDASLSAAEDAEVKRLMNETRMWRLANTAQWVAWGIVQAKVPGMPEFGNGEERGVKEGGQVNNTEDGAHELLAERAEEYKTVAKKENDSPPVLREEEQEEFDYLGYAQHRAMFFWGDAIQLGLAKAEDLPVEMRSKIKTVPH